MIYTNGSETIHAHKITGIVHVDLPGFPGAAIIELEGGRHSTLYPPWVAEHNPEAGGYFVIDEDFNGAKFMNAQEFEKQYRGVA